MLLNRKEKMPEKYNTDKYTQKKRLIFKKKFFYK